MVRLALILLALLVPALAQGEKPLLAGTTTLSARYPYGRGISYGPARALARALGLGYLKTASGLYLTLGARGIRLLVLPSDREAVRANPPEAFAEDGVIYVPLKRVAKALGIRYVGSEAALRMTLPPARLVSSTLSTPQGQDWLWVQFSRDANAVPLGEGTFLVLGGTTEAGFKPLFGRYLFGLTTEAHPLGLVLRLEGASGLALDWGPGPGGLWFAIGPKPPSFRPRQVAVGYDRPEDKPLAKALVAALERTGLRAALTAGPPGLAAVYLLVGRESPAAVYRYRPRDPAAWPAFIRRAREALALNPDPALEQQVAPIAASQALAERLAKALGTGVGQAEIRKLAYAPKAAAYVGLDPNADPATALNRVAAAVKAYLEANP